MNKIVFLLLSIAIFGCGSTFETTGTVISDNEKIITSRYMGYVQKVFVSEGEHVKAGQILYTIDSKEMDANRQQIQLMIEQAKIGVAMRENQYFDIKTNLERYKRLYEKGLVAKYDVEQLELGEKNIANMVAIAKSQLAQAQANLQSVDNQFNYLEIKSPNDGIIIKKMVKVGEMAIPAMPAFITTDLADIKIATEVGESQLSQIKIGKKVALTIPAANFSSFGTVQSIIPSSNPLTHSFTVKIKFKKNSLVYPGMYAKISW